MQDHPRGDQAGNGEGKKIGQEQGAEARRPTEPAELFGHRLAPDLLDRVVHVAEGVLAEGSGGFLPEAWDPRTRKAALRKIAKDLEREVLAEQD